ncbi:MAG: hypothetical protein LAO20_21430 [Acidobacteriia bacterium]|nr:hypothetical protein [Terriglobia bacterium]
MDEHTTVEEHFRGYFTGDYDGSYQTPQADRARHDFDRLTGFRLIWAQVHGNLKDAAKRALFKPYPHWPELYECCRDAIREHIALETEHSGGTTCARIMRDAMTILRVRHGLNVPRWWLPIMDELRGKNHETEKLKSLVGRR